MTVPLILPVKLFRWEAPAPISVLTPVKEDAVTQTIIKDAVIMTQIPAQNGILPRAVKEVLLVGTVTATTTKDQTGIVPVVIVNTTVTTALLATPRNMTI